MKLLKWAYEKTTKRGAPYYYNYSLWTVLIKPIRKWFSAVFIPSIPFNTVRIVLYRFCGYNIGKNVFIGMNCYLDDMCADLITIEDNITISYGCYFACHGKNQPHLPIIIKSGAYIGMCARIISPKNSGGVIIGKNAVIGAASLVNKSVPDGATAVGNPIMILDKEDSE